MPHGAFHLSVPPLTLPSSLYCSNILVKSLLRSGLSSNTALFTSLGSLLFILLSWLTLFWTLILTLKVPVQSTLFMCQSSASDNLCMTWSEDLNIEIEVEVWQTVMKHVHTSSICIHHGLLQCKVYAESTGLKANWLTFILALIQIVMNDTEDQLISLTLWTWPVFSLFWKSIKDWQY